jgi:hypothetical protein
MKQLYVFICLVLMVTFKGFTQNFTGFLNGTQNTSTGKIVINLNNLNTDFLLVSYLASGLGSNDIGFDRGKITSQRLVQFKRFGNTIALIEKNTAFRAISNNVQEVKAVEDAFAFAILFSTPIVAENGGVVSIEINSLLTDDLSDIAGQLKEQKQGNYKLDKTKSLIVPEALLAFPKNNEFESWLTFTGEAQGDYLKSVAVNKDIISLRQHISFVALPDSGFNQRAYHPYSGFFTGSYADYATPIHEPLTKRFIYKHRLQKKDPTAKKSEPINPIVYYVDNGCPEPIKSALIEGAQWWNQAFENAGFINAFIVKELPLDAHPLDVRYNTIQWVHRSTRGWSYGASITDPRTGEIIKGHVSLGSLRVRQDYLLAQGLLAPFKTNNTNNTEMLQMALARLRQLSAHEVGHTLGLAHNFAASTNNRASVMDYPHPLVERGGNILNLKNAYATGIADWDKHAIAYGYTQFENNEATELQKIITDVKRKGLRFISDPDARPFGSASADGHLWDNGTNPIAELKRVLDYRERAINQFGINNITDGTPFSELEKVFVPLYYAHRFQTEATAKLVGGFNFDYAVKGTDRKPTFENIPLDKQQEAIAEIMQTISPNILTVPNNIKALLVPNAYGYNFNRESFKNETGYGFDQFAAATSAIDHAYTLLLHEQRLARINNQGLMQLQDYFNLLLSHTQIQNTLTDAPLKIAIIKQRNLVYRLIGLAKDFKKPFTAAAANAALQNVFTKNYDAETNALVKEHYAFLKLLATRFTANEPIDLPAPLPLPPGEPIGDF